MESRIWLWWTYTMELAPSRNMIKWQIRKIHNMHSKLLNINYFFNIHYKLLSINNFFNIHYKLLMINYSFSCIVTRTMICIMKYSKQFTPVPQWFTSWIVFNSLQRLWMKWQNLSWVQLARPSLWPPATLKLNILQIGHHSTHTNKDAQSMQSL